MIASIVVRLIGLFNMTLWKCNVCGYEVVADVPPEHCISCGSASGEFYEKGKHPRDNLKGTPELLIINGSKHRAHNTALFATIAADVAKQRGVSYKLLHLADYKIDPCWCCYSMKEDLCKLPCRNAADDMYEMHRLVLNAKAVVVCSPINWNNMSVKLKMFLDRLTCIENMYIIDGSIPLAGRTVGIVVDGHEDGAYKTAFDIFMVFQNLGYIMAPYGIAYSTHGRRNKSESDNDFFKGDELMKQYVQNVTNNVIDMARLDIDKKMEIRPSCE